MFKNGIFGERSTQRQTPEFERVPEFNILAQQRSRGDGLDQKEKSIKMSISSTSFLCVISRHVELTTCAQKMRGVSTSVVFLSQQDADHDCLGTFRGGVIQTVTGS
jgi:hypothetical protein